MKLSLVALSLALLLAPFTARSAPNVNAEKWVAYGRQQAQAGQYDQAIVSFNNALKFDNSSATAYQGLGSCYWSKGDKEKALTNYKYSLQINPNNPQLKAFVDANSGAAAAAPGGAEDKYLPMGNQYMAAKQYDYAIWAFNKSLELNPNNAKAQQALGNAFYAKGQKDKALAAWDKSLALDPSNTALKTYVDNLRSGAQAAAPEGTPEAVIPQGTNLYLMVGAVIGVGALMIFLF